MVSVPPNSAWFSIANFRYYAVRDDLPLRFMRAWDDEPLGVDYMILKTGDVGPPWTAERPRRIVARLAADRHLDAAFPVIGEFPLPDGSRATVRARRLPVVSGAADTLARALAGALRQRAADVARDVEGLEVAVEPGDAIQQGRARRVVVSATGAGGVSVPAAARPCALAAERVRVGAVPVPSLLGGWVMNGIDPSRGIAARLPFPVEVARIEIAPAGLQVGGS